MRRWPIYWLLELQLSPLGRQLADLRRVELGGRGYLQFNLPGGLTPEISYELGAMATLDAFFIYYAALGGQTGPFLQPLDTAFTPAWSPDLVMTRRYRQDHRAVDTLASQHCYSSDLADRPWNALRVLDPLSGGGTTLFTALMGADAAGVEQDENDVRITVTFFKQYAQQQRVNHTVKEERLKKVGRRWTFEIGKRNASPAQRQQCILAQGDAAQSAQLIAGFKPHLIVTDLPYGIQHQGKLNALLSSALPVWEALLPPSGALALAWDATRFGRAEMTALVQQSCSLRVLDEDLYAQFGHQVDRVIKQREVLVARR
ncbi:MAG: hypothetical protein R2911_39825 [Caldilineaceae bacterium]